MAEPLASAAADDVASVGWRPGTRSGRVPGQAGLRVGVVGCGYWGAKHVRVLSALQEVREVVLVETDARKRSRLEAAFPAARPFADLETALPHADAFVIATPPQSHAEMALAAIRHGRHVLIEKPLAPSLTEARQLVDEADRHGTTLMVGHTFEFNPAVRELRRRLESGELGQVHYVHSARLNLGLYRSDVNVVWDLAPHDVSILNYLLNARPASVSAWGARNAAAGVEDLAYVRLTYPEVGVAGYIHVSWLDPKKVRRVTVVGSAKMAEYDDLAEERLRIFDRGVQPASEASFERPVSYRYGDIVSPHLGADEPLALEDRHFIESIQNGTVPQSDGRSGLTVVAILEAIDEAVATGRIVPVAYPDLPASEAGDLITSAAE